MSQRERTSRHKEKHPEGERIRKERQRQKESVIRFHIKRKHLYDYAIPDCVDTTSDMFKRVYDACMAEIAEPVEVVHS